ncbi:hypothetical protein ACIBW9_16130 [Streptomyces sp. NPDC049541]|uniref:hypothetical protein n=1 Tax=Streptomyces sp. NPDC049541 TaxID=3365594 RepID=UPI0037BD2857
MSPGSWRPGAGEATDRPRRPRPAASLRFGYGTNGLADLRLDDALALLGRRLGRKVSLT